MSIYHIFLHTFTILNLFLTFQFVLFNADFSLCIFKCFKFLYTCVSEYPCVALGVRVEIRGQFAGVGSFFPPHGCWGCSSGH